jgi:diguanylate cyclase (GGDEF)-like protein
MLGYTQSEAMKHITSVRQLYYDELDRDIFLEELSAHREVRHRKIRFLKKTGERIWISMTARIDPGTDDSDTTEPSNGYEIEGFLIDITSDMEERQSLVSMAESDALTGAANRRAFDSSAETVAEHARSTGQTVALIVFDVDKFKTINDTYGHEAGDRLLRHVVEIGHRQIRESDLFARLGGDEFAILLPGSGKEAACSLAKRLQNGIYSSSPPEPLSEPPTLSIGVSVLSGADVQVPELLKAADTAMYRAKQSGRNRIECRTDIDS